VKNEKDDADDYSDEPDIDIVVADAFERREWFPIFEELKLSYEVLSKYSMKRGNRK